MFEALQSVGYEGGSTEDAQVLHRKLFTVMVGDRVYKYTHIPVKYIDEIIFAYMHEQERTNTAMLLKVAELQREGKLAQNFTIGPEVMADLIEAGAVQLFDFGIIMEMLVGNAKLMVAEQLETSVEWVEENISVQEYAKLIAFVKNDPDVINGANILLKNVLTPAMPLP